MSYDPNNLTGVYYPNHPETGEPGQWRLFQDQGWVNLDPNAPKDVYWNERGQNYMGELGQYYTVNPNTGEVSIDDDGNGRWYYSGMLGWVNTKPAEVQPAPGPVSFGNFDGGLAGPTGQGQTTTSNNTSSSTNTGSNTGGGNNSVTNQPVGYYWAQINGAWQWLPVYAGEAPLDGAVYVEGSTAPTAPPAGYDSSGPTTGSSGGLTTPDASMLFNGMFTAQDMLRRNGGPITSSFYDGARQQILDSLAQQATAAGRTQNTAEEIAAAQASIPQFSGLFNPDYAAILRNLNLNV